MANTGAMVACFLPSALAESLALPGGEAADQLHVTLAFLGKADDLTVGNVGRLRELAGAISLSFAPIPAKISGVGRFSAPEGDPDPFYLSVDAPSLPAFRQAVFDSLKSASLPVAEDHGFTPHVTIAYLPKGVPDPIETINQLDFIFSELAVTIGDNIMVWPLRGQKRGMLKDFSVGRPFGGYNDFDDCLAKNQDKENPEAYCGMIQAKVEGGKKKRTDLIERYSDVFTDALKEMLKGKVNDDDWRAAIRYARAKAGGVASAEAKLKKVEEDMQISAIAKLIGGTPLTSLSDLEVLSLEEVLREALP